MLNIKQIAETLNEVGHPLSDHMIRYYVRNCGVPSIAQIGLTKYYPDDTPDFIVTVILGVRRGKENKFVYHYGVNSNNLQDTLFELDEFEELNNFDEFDD